MGKSSGKKKKQAGENLADANSKQTKTVENGSKAYDKDTAVFIAMSQELKDEGNRLFQRRDYEGAMLKYEKALKLLPRNHIDVAYLRSNMAQCYMQMGIGDYPRAIHECNLALEVSAKYSKALIKRARCYEGLNRLELALRDLNTVLSVEPNNLTALEIAERVKQEIENRGVGVNGHPFLEYTEPPCVSTPPKEVKEKSRRRKNCKSEDKKVDDNLEKISEDKEDGKAEARMENGVKDDEKKAEDKMVVEEKFTTSKGDEPKKTVKLVFGEDIRWAQLPMNCNLLKLRKVVQERFPMSKAALVKYKDQEGDMITITTDEELRWAEASADPRGSIKLYIVEVSPEIDPFYEELHMEDSDTKPREIFENGSTKKGSACIEEWIVEFAQLFKNYVGFSSDAYLDLHEIGVKLYSEAMEDTVTSEEAQVLFDMAAEKFQEMAALALFNWGNVHMSRARKRVHFTEGSSHESILDEVKSVYDWAQKEYVQAGKRYEEALRIKPDFYEGHQALGQQQFERAKLAWYYAVTNNVDLETWSSAEVLELYNNAEENMEKGMQMWEELEQKHQSEHTEPSKSYARLQKMGLERLFEDVSTNEIAEQVATMRSQINILMGTMLYERSIMEFKLGLPVWHECLEVAVEKFEQAGVSQTDITIMIKNHCSNDSAVEGLGFRIDELVQAWNEMDEAKRRYSGVPSFRLGPLLRRRASKLYDALEQG